MTAFRKRTVPASVCQDELLCTTARFALLLGRDAYHQFPLARAVQFDQYDSLPGAEDEIAMLEGQRDRCPDESRENVIGNVLRVMGMTVAELGNHGFESVEHVEIGAWIQIRGGKGGCGVEDEQAADSGGGGVILLEQGLHRFGDVEDFTLLAGFDG